MCGRYASSASEAELVEIFVVDEVRAPLVPAPWQAPRFNVAPTDLVSAVMTRSARSSDIPGATVRTLAAPRWGLVPSWSKGPKSGPLMINARAETVAVKPAYRRAFRSRRCLLPAIGYYEWYPLDSGSPQVPPSGSDRAGPRKQPFFIHPNEGPMVMAGLYEFWRDPDLEGDEAWLLSCTIITTEATDDLGRIHPRMPVQILAEHVDDWLDPDLTDPDQIAALMHRPERGEMSAYAVSPLVNKVGNDGPELLAPLPES